MVDPSVNLSSLAAQIALGGGLFYGVQKFFKELEDKLTPEARLSFGFWLTDQGLYRAAQRLLITFSGLLEKVFGADHLTWLCFIRSAIASVCSSAFVWLTVLLTSTSFTAASLRQTALEIVLSHARAFDILIILRVLFVLMVVNVIPDYLSLLATRILLTVGRNFQSIGLIVVVLAADMVATLTIACGPAYLIYNALWLGADSSLRSIYTEMSAKSPEEGEKAIRTFEESVRTDSNTPKRMLDDIVAVMRSGYQHRRDLYQHYRMDLRDGIGYWEIFDVTILPSCFTSLWLWMYALAVIILKLALRSTRFIAIWARFLDVKNHPLQCIGLISGCSASILFWLISAIRTFAVRSS